MCIAKINSTITNSKRHKISQEGPGLTIGDVNGDGLDDFFIGNAEGFKGAMYVQTVKSTFKEVPGPWLNDSLFEDTGALLFDADGDGKPDLYVVSGGNDGRKKADCYGDRLYLNTGKGFVKEENSLSISVNQSGKCVKAADFDNDGHPDLFVGGRIVPGKYPLPANSLLLRNNGKAGSELRFEDVTLQIAPGFSKLGMVTDAVWDDFNRDGKIDIIIVGEWMGIRFFENTATGFADVSENLGFGKTTGWWYSINIADVDNDGDNDYIVGNLGLNYKYKAGPGQSFDIYSNDFDLNGHRDIVLGYKENGINYPVMGLDASSLQIPILKLRYQTYEDYAKATLEELYGEKMLEESLHYTINTFAHYWIENKGNNKFEMHMLPAMAQFSSINDMIEINYKNDKPAFIVGGNLYESESETPRDDASIGLVMQYDSNGIIKAIPPAESTLLIRGEVKDIGKIKLASGKEAYLFAINNDSLKLVEFNPGNK